MIRPPTLVGLFLRDLIRRRSLWILVVVFAGLVWVGKTVEDSYLVALEQSERYDLATQAARKDLLDWASRIRDAFLYLMLVFAAFVAPESRRNGTMQYLLALPVSRGRIAAAQFASLSILLWTGGLAIHAGFTWIALRYEAISPAQMLFGWIFLVGPVWLASVMPFAFALRFSTVGTLILVFVLPLLLFGVPDMIEADLHPLLAWLEGIAEEAGLLTLMFLDELLIWPQLPADFATERFPDSTFLWIALHSVAVLGLWTVVATWLYGHYDFGSRNAVK